MKKAKTDSFKRYSVLWPWFSYMVRVKSKLQGSPERSRQSNLAVFAVESGLDAKFLYVKTYHFAVDIFHCLSINSIYNWFLPYIKNKSQTTLRHASKHSESLMNIDMQKLLLFILSTVCTWSKVSFDILEAIL